MPGEKIDVPLVIPMTLKKINLVAVLFVCATTLAVHAWGQEPAVKASTNQVDAAGQQKVEAKTPIIQDNSFLVEEAYNQELGVVQHIQTFQRSWQTHEWTYGFTQEWPFNPAPKHQLSYTIIGLNSADGTGTGLGDVFLNYRYQLVGSGESKYAFAPRLSLILPTGDYKRGHGAGGIGYQVMLPFSWVHNSKLTTHWNLGSTVTPSQKNSAGETAKTYGVNAGQSFVWNLNSRVNLLMETVWNTSENVISKDQKEREHSVFINPGCTLGL
jgi:hypothetical protein